MSNKRKRRVIYDIEANGLVNVDRIWCLVARDIDTGERFSFYPKETCDCPVCGGDKKTTSSPDSPPWLEDFEKTIDDLEKESLEKDFETLDFSQSANCNFCYGSGKIYQGDHQEWKDDFLKFAEEVDLWIGHNIIGYDNRVLNDVLGFKITLKHTYDTLVMSRLLRPVSPFKNMIPYLKHDSRLGGHGLDAWGERLGFSKLKFNDFEKFSLKQLEYCERDVDLNFKIFEALEKEKTDFNISNTCIELEHKVAYYLSLQEQNGFYLVRENAEKLEKETSEKLEEMELKLKELFPPKKKVIKTVKAKINKDGSLSKVTKKTLDNNLYDDNGDGSYDIYTMEEFNPRSPRQVGERLLDLGWNPSKFTPSGLPSTDKVSIWNAIESLEAKHENVRALGNYNIVADRNQKANKWLELVDSEDGYNDHRVHGRINPIGAATHRCSHFDDNMANISSVKTDELVLKNKPEFDVFEEFQPNKIFLEYEEKNGAYEVEYAAKGLEGYYGWDCRNCWGVPDGKILVGADASGIQLRALAHYMNDPEYTENLIKGDIHTVHQKAAGLINRPTAKTFIYAWLLGAGDEKIGIISGIENEKEMEELFQYARDSKAPYGKDDLLSYFIHKIRRQGRKATRLTVAYNIKGFIAKKQFLDRTPALKRLKEKEIPEASKKGYLIGLDGRRLWIPSEHLAMSLYLQGFEAVIMKAAIVFYSQDLNKKGIPFKQVAFVHDEVQVETYPEYAEEVGSSFVRAIEKAGEVFGSNCPLTGEYKIGATWAMTH